MSSNSATLKEKIRSSLATTQWTEEAIIALASTIQASDKRTRNQVEQRWQSLCKPLFSLGMLENAVTDVAAAQRNVQPRLERTAIVEFCADHGVVGAGVTQAGQEVTAEVLRHFLTGQTSANLMAQRLDVDLYAVDLGVATLIEPLSEAINFRLMPKGTHNLHLEPAIPRPLVYQAVGAGITIAQQLSADYDVLIGGEMGIGNTTSSTAVLCAILGGDPYAWTGRGSGLDNAALAKKKQVIADALERLRSQTDSPSIWQICSELGGLEVLALAGFYLGAAACHIPILLDGVISLAAACIAREFNTLVTDYLIATHSPREQAAQNALAILGRKPWIAASLAAGEGVGGLLGLAQLRLASAVFADLWTFGEGNVVAYEKLSEPDV